MQRLSKKFLDQPLEDLREESKIKFEVFQNKDKLSKHFAQMIADEIKENNLAGKPTRLILPVGPTSQYPILAEICNLQKISWRNVFTFNMDEYCDWQGRALPIDHPLSFEGFMFKNLFEKLEPELRIPANQAHFPDPLNLDAISQQIEKVGGIDSCYGGIGYHGHIAFNEPPVSRWFSLSIEEFKNSLTRMVEISPDSIVMNSTRNAGGNSADFPSMGVTLGMKDILSAKRIRLYCPGGAWQRYIVRVACFGVEDIDYPVTLLQDHKDCQLIVDKETGAPPFTGLE